MNPTTKKIAFVVSLILLAVTLLIYSCGRDNRLDDEAVSAELAPGVVKKIVINPQARTLSVITPSSPREDLFLPDRPSTITVDKQGKVEVTVQEKGTEMSPFLGLGVAEKPRFYIGFYGLYYKRLDLGLFASVQPTSYTSTRAGIALGYLIRKDISLMIGIDNKKEVNAGITIKI